MSEFPERHFSLDQEQRDSLRLEAQSLSPREKEEFSGFVRDCHHAILELWGDFILEKQDDEGIVEKFLLMDQSIYEEFFDEWSPKAKISITYLPEGEKGHMRFFEEGRILAGYIPDSFLLLDQQNQEKLIKREGSLEAAKQYARYVTTRFFVVHEVAHMYQDPTLPLWFMECGAYYYARAAIRSKNWGKFEEANYMKMADFYQELLDKYGDDVYRIFFGQSQDEERKQEVFSELTDARKESIFPDYRVKF